MIVTVELKNVELTRQESSAMQGAASWSTVVREPEEVRAGTKVGGLNPFSVTVRLIQRIVSNPDISSEKGGRKIISSNFMKWFTGHFFSLLSRIRLYGLNAPNERFSQLC